MPDDFTIENETLTPRQRSQRARRAAERERGAAAAAQVEGTLRKQVGLPEAEASVIEPAPPADPNSPTTPAEGPKERIDYADPPPAATSPRSSFEASEGQFSRDQQERRTAEMLQQIDEQTAQPVRTPPPAQAAAEGDPEGIRLGGFLQGVADPFRQVVGGARDAIQNSLTALDSFAAFMNENVADFSAFEWRTAETTADGSRGALKEVLPEVAAPTTVAGGITRGISQFVFGFIPLLKGLKMAAGTKTASSVLLKFYQTEVAAGLATTLVFDPAEQNLSALIQEYPSLSNPVAEFLATNPDDSDAVNRLKTGVEGLLVGAGIEGAVAGAAFLKSLLPLRARRAQEGIVPREADEIEFAALGDPDADVISFGDAATPEREVPLEIIGAPDRAQNAPLKQAVIDWLDKKEGAKVPFKINWAKVSTTEDIEELVRSVSSSFSGTIDEARRGSISQQQTMEMADQLGMSVDDLINRKTGQAFNAEEVVASRMILESSANQLIEMGRRFQHSTDETEMFQLMRMMNIHVGIQAQFQGAASEAGRALRAYQIPKGSAANQILEIQQQLMAGGGPC